MQRSLISMNEDKTAFVWGHLEPSWCQSSSKVFTFLEKKEIYLKTNALRHASPWCMRKCTWDCLYKYNKINCLNDYIYIYILGYVYIPGTYMYLGLFIYLWIWKGWNFWKPSISYKVHTWDILVWNNIQDPKFLGLPSNLRCFIFLMKPPFLSLDIAL